MKYLSKILGVLFLSMAITAVVAQEKPKITFAKMAHDFGTFKENAGVQSTEFAFTNEGKVPLVLNNVQASCGCTTPEWTREPVAPGQKGMIKVSYDPRNRPGTFNKTVTVQSNAENAVVVLSISGTVQERELTLAEIYPYDLGGLRAKTSNISFIRLLNNEVQTQELEVVNDSDAPIKVGLRQVPDYVKAKIEPETIASKGKAKLTVTLDAKATNTWGFLANRIYLSLNGSNDYKSSVGISATIEEDFSKLTPEQLANAPAAVYEPLNYDFGDIKQDKDAEYTFTLKNTGKSDLIIRNVRSSCGCTAVTPSKTVIKPGETAPIKVSFDPRGKRGKQSKSVTVITNDPKNSTVTLYISSNVLAEN